MSLANAGIGIQRQPRLEPGTYFVRIDRFTQIPSQLQPHPLFVLEGTVLEASPGSGSEPGSPFAYLQGMAPSKYPGKAALWESAINGLLLGLSGLEVSKLGELLAIADTVFTAACGTANPLMGATVRVNVSPNMRVAKTGPNAGKVQVDQAGKPYNDYSWFGGSSWDLMRSLAGGAPTMPALPPGLPACPPGYRWTVEAGAVKMVQG